MTAFHVGERVRFTGRSDEPLGVIVRDAGMEHYDVELDDGWELGAVDGSWLFLVREATCPAAGVARCGSRCVVVRELSAGPGRH